MLRSDVVAGAAVFRDGASAEAAAIRLAQGLADAGQTTRVEIHGRDGRLRRSFVVPARARREGSRPDDAERG